jgi:hypothetical protein
MQFTAQKYSMLMLNVVHADFNNWVHYAECPGTLNYYKQYCSIELGLIKGLWGEARDTMITKGYEAMS